MAQTAKSQLQPQRTKPEKPEKPKSMVQADDVISQREEFENDTSPPQLRMGLTQHKIHQKLQSLNKNSAYYEKIKEAYKRAYQQMVINQSIALVDARTMSPDQVFKEFQRGCLVKLIQDIKRSYQRLYNTQQEYNTKFA